MNKVIGFGDYIVRLNPPGYLRFTQAESFEINYTGAEANVLASLSWLGIETEFVTKLPENDIAKSGVAMLRKLGVGTRHIAYGGERIGVFYLEKGASQRPSRIVYDRKHTSIATASAEDFDWDEIMKGGSRFHFTGITPGLGKNMPLICAAACKAAKKHGLSISCDLNYRKSLWTPEEARETMAGLLQYVDLLIANEEDSEKVLGIKAKDTNIISGKLSRDGYAEVAENICGAYGVKAVGVTLRESTSASDNVWSAMLYSGGKPYFSKKYHIHIVDRVGGGDAFAAGLIYGAEKGFGPQTQIEFAAAASCLKHTVEKDYNLVTVDEILFLMGGDGSGRVQR